MPEAVSAYDPPAIALHHDLIARMHRLRLMVFDFDGVFTDNAVLVLEDGREAVRCWRGDGLGLDQLRRLGIELLVISTETNPVVTARCRKLKLTAIQGCGNKRAALSGILAERGLGWDQAGFMGNDINDAACLKAVGLPVVPADAHAQVMDLALYRTRARGGQGAVREWCDRLVEILGPLPEAPPAADEDLEGQKDLEGRKDLEDQRA